MCDGFERRRDLVAGRVDGCRGALTNEVLRIAAVGEDPHRRRVASHRELRNRRQVLPPTEIVAVLCGRRRVRRDIQCTTVPLPDVADATGLRNVAAVEGAQAQDAAAPTVSGVLVPSASTVCVDGARLVTQLAPAA